MTETWRLLRTGAMDAASNMALDEAVLSLNKGKKEGTLRFYSWEPKAISIGYFQGINEEVDIRKCEELGVDVVRRITGGGAVYHDDELTYSVIVDERHPNISNNILESYDYLCKGIVNGLERLGIDSEFKPINDIITGGKKISGNAQTRRMGSVLQHGTILRTVDVRTMFDLLLVPDEKIRDKMISAVEERVTSISDMLGEKVQDDRILEAMVEGFSEGLGVKLEPGEPTSEEWEMMKTIRSEKYGTREWNFKR
ncbi:MAG: lipoate--protein ligase family protein [Thermoplasmata archaeon]|nr:lipoate--protein ligase family protein [Thermoplasmata archaeon]